MLGLPSSSAALMILLGPPPPSLPFSVVLTSTAYPIAVAWESALTRLNFDNDFDVEHMLDVHQPNAERVWVLSSVGFNETTCICVSRLIISEGIKRLASTTVFTSANAPHSSRACAET